MSLIVGFVTGTTPDKWAARWRERSKTLLELRPMAESDAAHAIVAGDVDMVIARLPIDLPSWDIHSVPLYQEQVVAVLPVDHWLSLADGVTVRDLVDEQIINDPADVPGVLGQSPRLDWPAMTPKEAIETVASGTGCYVAPASVARLFGRKDVVARPITDLPERGVHLVWLRDRDDAATQAFVGIVKGRTANTSRD